MQLKDIPSQPTPEASPQPVLEAPLTDYWTELETPRTPIFETQADSAPDADSNLIDQKPSRGWSILKVLLLLIAGAGSLLGLLFIAALFMVTSSGGCGNKARQSEVKQNVGSMNRGQQAFYLEHGRFSKSVKALGLGIQTQTYNYQYLTQGTKTAAFSYGIARNDQVKSYVGATFLLPETGQSNKTKSEPWMVTVLCEANRFGVYQPANPTLQKGTPTCPEGTKTIETR